MTSNVSIIKSLNPPANIVEDTKGSMELDRIGNLLNILSDTVWSHQAKREHNAWETCLCQMILTLDPGIRLVNVSEAIPYGMACLDHVGMMNTMANLGYTTRVMRVRLGDIDKRILPCLFIPDSSPNSPAVILDKDTMYHGNDRALRKIPHKSTVSGQAIIFVRADKTGEESSRLLRQGTGYSWFRAFVGRFHKTILNIFFGGLVLNLIGLATPLFIMLVYDRVISSYASNILIPLAFGAVIAIASESVLRVIRSKALSWLGGRVDNIVSNMIFDHLLHLSPGYIERASVSSQIARIKTFESIRDFFSGSMFLSVLELPFVLVALLAIGIIAGPLVFVPIGMAFLYCALFYFVWRKVKVQIRIAAKAGSARQQFALDTFDKAEAIRINGLSHVWEEKYRDLSGRENVAQFQLGWLGMIGETLANALTVLSAVAIVGFGVHFIWVGELTTGGLVATMILVWRVLGPFYSLNTMIPRLEQLRNSIRQVNGLMDIDTEEMAARGLARPSRLRGRVTFSNAGLRYSQNEDPVLAGINFESKPGDVIAITGENGSGKTSFLKMIKGMYIPSAGSLRLDGFDIRQLDPHDIRRNIAYIPQKSDFFRGTISENLRFGNPLATDGEIKQALGQANVLDEIMALPLGLNTIIGGKDGLRLSSSLETRLSMVRAYLQESPIMLIDELPNTLMSEDAGRFLHDTIMRHKGKQTVFIVTYRQDFLDMADTVIFLRRGYVPQIGPGRSMIERLKKSLW